MPGGGDIPILPGGGVDYDSMQQALTEIVSTADQIHGKLADDMIGQMKEVDAVCADIQGRYQGSAGLLLDEIVKTCDKVKGKINDAMSQDMRSVYGYMGAVGLPIPSRSDLEAFKATGDPMAGFGLDDSTPETIDNASIPPPVTTVGDNGLQTLDLTGGTGETIYLGLNECVTVPQLGPVPTVVCPAGSIPVRVWPDKICCSVPGPGLDGPPPTQETCPPGMMPNPNLGSNQGTVPLVLPGPGPAQQGNGTLPGPTRTLQNGRRPLQGPGSGGYGANQQWQPTSTINGINDQLNADGQACYLLARTDQRPDITPSSSLNVNGTNVFPVQAWNPAFPPPPPPDAWDIVDIRPPIAPTWPLYGGQAWGLVPAGYQIFTDQSTGIAYAAPTIPSWGCRKGEISRLHGTAPTTGDTGGNGGGVIPPPGGEPACVPIPDDNQICGVTAFACAPPDSRPIPTVTPKDSDFCKWIDKGISDLKTSTPSFSNFINVAGGFAVESALPGAEILKWAFGTDQTLLPSLVQRFANWMQGIVEKSSAGFNCDRATSMPLLVMRGVMRFIEEWTGIVPEQFLDTLEQMSHTACQSKIPSPAEADAAWLTDAISEETWRCYHKSAGNYVDEFKPIRDGKRHKLNARETILSHWRKYIDDDRYQTLMRQNGVTTDTDRSEVEAFEQYWLSWSELIEFMGKDAFDQNTVDTFGLDQGFDAAYTDDAKYWAKGAGIADQLMQYKWRAHWRNLGPEMMIRSAQRLRPGQVDDSVAVSMPDLKKALQQQDIMPYWVDRLIKLAEKLITESDLVRLYMDHKLDTDELTERLKDYGYSQDNAQKLSDDYKARRDINDYRSAGYPTVPQAVQLYSQCLIDDSTFQTIITNMSMSEEQAGSAMEAADIKREVVQRKNALKTIQREYRLGLIDDDVATQMINGMGVDPGCIPGLVRAMKRQRQKLPKTASASQLCKFRDQGIITAEQQVEALIRMGYQASDAYRIAESCAIDNVKRHEKTSRKKVKERITKATGGKTTVTDETIESQTTTDE